MNAELFSAGLTFTRGTGYAMAIKTPAKKKPVAKAKVPAKLAKPASKAKSR